MSRTTILFIALLGMGVLLGLLSLAMARGERRSRALWLWGWGLIVYAAGQSFFVVRSHSPGDLHVTIGNGMICLAALLTALGVYQHTPVRISRSLLLGGLAAAILVDTASQVFRWGIIADIAVPTVYATLLYAAAAVLLLWRPPSAARTAARFMAGTIIAQLLIWNIRLAAIWLSLGSAGQSDRVDVVVSLFAVAQILAVVAATLGMLWIEVRLMQSHLTHAAFSDQLTGVLNRRAMLMRFDEEVARCKRFNHKLGLVLFDVDRFKHINDTRGHHLGDRLLRQIALDMGRCKRKEDVLGRIGGEEFLVLLPHHDLEKSVSAAERLRQVVERSKPDTGEEAFITVSGGVAIYPDDGESWDRLYVVADQRMYRAKRAGRNQVMGRDAQAGST